MQYVDVQAGREMMIHVPSPHAPVRGIVVDCQGEDLIVRVPELHQIPEHVFIVMSQWEAPSFVKATYENWWFLNRPLEQDCKRIQRRAFVRIRYSTVLKVKSKFTDGELAVETLDLSAGGCMVKSIVPLGFQDEPVEVSLSLPTLPFTRVQAEIARISVDPDGTTRYGLRFKHMMSLYQEQMVQFVTQQIQNALKQGHDITAK
jgi:c-di-GMP-binding flagellar brake protein YcgR